MGGSTKMYEHEYWKEIWPRARALALAVILTVRVRVARESKTAVKQSGASCAQDAEQLKMSCDREVVYFGRGCRHKSGDSGRGVTGSRFVQSISTSASIASSGHLRNSRHIRSEPFHTTMPKKDKKSSKAKDGEAGAKPEEAAPAAAEWTCEECGQENEPTDDVCCACEEPRPQSSAGDLAKDCQSESCRLSHPSAGL